MIYSDDNIHDALEKTASKRHIAVEQLRTLLRPESGIGKAYRTMLESQKQALRQQVTAPRWKPRKRFAQKQQAAQELSDHIRTPEWRNSPAGQAAREYAQRIIRAGGKSRSAPLLGA